MIYEKDFITRQIRNLVRFLLAKSDSNKEDESNESHDQSGSDSLSFLRNLFEETSNISKAFLAAGLLPTLKSMVSILTSA